MAEHIVGSSSDSVPATPDEMDEESVGSPATPGSGQSSQACTPLDPPLPESPKELPKRVPSLRSVSDPPIMHPNSTALGTLSSARRPPAASVLGGPLAGSDAMLKARSLAQSRMGRLASPPTASPTDGSGRASPIGTGVSAGFPSNLRLPPGLVRPGPPGNVHSAPAIAKQPLSARRGMKLSMAPSDSSPGAAPKLSDVTGNQDVNGVGRSKMDDFKKYIDAEKGWITFEGTATITRTGVNFSGGQTFHISLDEIEPLGELGKGNYGTVYMVRHAKPRVPRFGPGLSNFKRGTLNHASSDSALLRPREESDDTSPLSPAPGKCDTTTGIIMAMKEIRLELDEAKFTAILKELVILHECVSPNIIDFYGAFFQEGAVYMCIEYMDGGSIDKLYAGGIPEEALRKITYGTMMGLKTLKDEHNIIHRDVKPTNILVNTKGQVKICDFGVSGNLVASMAKTNIGCQSYMAPERISGGGMAQVGSADGTYNVQSDIWSLGLTIIECAMGRYPYPPEIASTIFSQLSAIVEGEPPDLPSEGYSQAARDFVRGCLNKVPKARPTYAMLLNHPWMTPISKPETITEEAEDDVDGMAESMERLDLRSGTEDPVVAEWVQAALERKRSVVGEANTKKPALHAAPLDSVSPVSSPRASADVPGP